MDQLLDDITDFQTTYAYGDCAVFAVALSRLYQLPIVEFYDGDGDFAEMFHVALLIEGATARQDKFIDVFGLVYNRTSKNGTVLSPQCVSKRKPNENYGACRSSTRMLSSARHRRQRCYLLPVVSRQCTPFVVSLHVWEPTSHHSDCPDGRAN